MYMINRTRVEELWSTAHMRDLEKVHHCYLVTQPVEKHFHEAFVCMCRGAEESYCPSLYLTTVIHLNTQGVAHCAQFQPFCLRHLQGDGEFRPKAVYIVQEVHTYGLSHR
jgi:hypothetical protein